MERHNPIVGKILYAILFLLAVPLLQWWWALSTKDFVTYPAIHSQTWGIAISAFGFLFMLYSMFTLMKFGKGLPMNAYPPKAFVSKGPYAVVSHPVYFGYAVMMIGVSIYFGSASALWLVTPLSILAMVALVVGYENIDLAKRFPNAENKAFFKVPSSSSNAITINERLASLLLTFLFCISCNYIIYFLAGDANSLLPARWALPAFDKLEILEHLATPFIFIVPLFAKGKHQLRH